MDWPRIKQVYNVAMHVLHIFVFVINTTAYYLDDIAYISFY